MRIVLFLLGCAMTAGVLTACGGGGGPGGTGGTIDPGPSCDDCLDEWSDETHDCTTQSDLCVASASDLHGFGPCFRALGSCMEDAYDDAASCLDDCGDQTTSNTLACGAYCESDAGYCFGYATDSFADCYDICDTTACLDDCDFYLDLDAAVCADSEDLCLSDCGL